VTPVEQRLAKLEARVEGLEAENGRLRAENAALKARVAELEAELGRNSSNSSKPPSSDAPATRAERPARGGSGKKPGGQPGHKGSRRALVPQDQVTKNHDVFPKRCQGCGSALGRESVGEPERHQVTELPKVVPQTEQWSLHTCACSCGRLTKACLPREAPGTAFGPNLMATIVLLVGGYRLSRRNVRRMMKELLGLDISLGSISNIEGRVGTALRPVHHEVAAAVRSADAKNLDATGWLHGGEARTLWVFASALATAFFVACDATRDTLAQLVGKAKGVLMSDRGGQFDLWAMSQRQICWAHLLRKFVQYSESKNHEAAIVGEQLLLYSRALLSGWHEVRDGTMTLRHFQREVIPRADNIICGLLERGVALGCPGVSGSCADILRHRAAFFTFAFEADVQPTNNHAEQQVRAFVLWRKTSFGSQSLRGDRFAERIMTVVQTCQKQGRHTLSFLRDVIGADLAGTPTPKLMRSTP
jgi:transposase